MPSISSYKTPKYDPNPVRPVLAKNNKSSTRDSAVSNPKKQ